LAQARCPFVTNPIIWVYDAFGPGLVVIAFIAVCLSTVWMSLADHPLHSDSERRHAAISIEMRETGIWTVPYSEDEPNLTKPPLSYWLEATSLGLWGDSEFAVRFPSAVAASLTIVVLGAAGWRIGGRSLGFLAAGGLSTMPLHVVMSRMALTDSLQSLFWFSTLIAGFLALTESDQHRWRILMWTAVALGLLSTGPVAWIPVGVLLAWLGCSGRWSQAQSLRLGTGLVLSALPLMVWAAGSLYRYPQSGAAWYQETIGRITHTADHAQPFWYLLPAFLGGLFPATAMMISGFNTSWRNAWRRLRAGDPTCLWWLAVALPLVMFSLVSGNMPGQLLPLAPPLALLTAMVLLRWLQGGSHDAKPGDRPPEIVATFFVTVLAITVAGCTIAYGFLGADHAWLAAPLVALAAVAGWLWWVWNRRPKRRGVGLTAVWLTLVACWWWGFEVEDFLVMPASAGELIADVHSRTGRDRLHVLTFGRADATLTFYNNEVLPRASNADELLLALERYPDVLIVLADPIDFRNLILSHPHVANRFDLVTSYRALPRIALRWIVLRPRITHG